MGRFKLHRNYWLIESARGGLERTHVPSLMHRKINTRREIDISINKNPTKENSKEYEPQLIAPLCHLDKSTCRENG